MFDIGTGELFLILVVVLIAFGPKKLPELAQSLGRGLREFRRAQREFTDQINSAIEVEHQKQTRTVGRVPTTTMYSETPGPVIAATATAAPTVDTPGIGAEPMIAPPHIVPPHAAVPGTISADTPPHASHDHPAGTAPASAPLPSDETSIGETRSDGPADGGAAQLPIFDAPEKG